MAPLINRRTLTIEWGQCDPAGIVFNPRYFELFDASTWLLIEALLKVKQHNFPAAYDIIGAPIVDASVNFMKPARFGDEVEIASRVKTVQRTSFEVEHRLSVRGELAVEGFEKRVWAVRDKRDPDRIRAVPIPTNVVEAFGGAPQTA